LNPRSIAVVGATERPGYGGRLLRNLLAHGYAGRVVAINPNRASVMGLPCLPSVLDLPEPVDLAAIVIPAAGVPAALAECRERGVPAALVISAGFAELGTAEGRSLEQRIARVAADGPRVCGPNCLGVANLAERVWATANVLAPVDERLRTGRVALISQSGATAFGPLLSLARQRGIGLRYVVSSGNEVDLTTPDYLDYMVADRHVAAVACVLEGVRDGAALRRAFEQASAADKPVVVLKIGRTETGAAAALSHTAALTGRDDLFDALLKQHGVARADGWEELLALADGLAKARRPRGRRVGVVSHSGGIGSLLADQCAALGLELPPLGPAAAERLAALLEGRGAARNPADVTGHFERETFETILALMLGEPAFDAVAVATAGGPPVAVRIAAAAEASARPLVACWTAGAEESEPLRTLREADVPITYEPAACARLLAAMVRWGESRRRAPARAPRSRDPEAGTKLHDLLGRRRAGRATPLPEQVGLELLGAAGVPTVRGARAPRPDDLADRVRAAGLRYPRAVKIESPDLPHKSDVGGVRLGVADEAELAAAAAEVWKSVRRARPEARLDGVLAQEMAPPGLELVLGMQPDPQLGPAVMLGLGGLWVEALGLRAWRLAPFRPGDADDLIGEAVGLGALLAGARGGPRLDRPALVDAVEAFAAWCAEVGGSLEAAELNPLLVRPEGQGVVAVDCLIVPR
jgi:acetyltransferase